MYIKCILRSLLDLDSITDIVEKTATIGIINNFGQTPRQLFKKPHPARGPAVNDPLALGYYVFQEHLEKLVQSVTPLRGNMTVFSATCIIYINM